jgi:putative transposase
MNLHLPIRKTIRIRGFDYTSNRNYFITFCTQSRWCLFGSVVNGKLCLNEAGIMVCNEIYNMQNKNVNVSFDTFVVMPNHVHAIVRIDNDVGLRIGLPDIVGQLKAYTTNEYIKGVYGKNWPSFNKKLWQRGYYEAIVNNDHSLKRIRRYIINNPSKWNDDVHFTDTN